MLFDIEQDAGDQITLYLLSDAFSSVSRINISSGGQTVHSMEANEVRESMVVAGRHKNGQCGFRIDTSMIPNLASLEDLEIHDEETGLLIYRRPSPAFISQRVLNLNCMLFPERVFEGYIQRFFQYRTTKLEIFGTETVLQIFNLDKYPSIFLSGRILYKNYAYLADVKYKTTFCLDDPYMIMAERLILLSKLHELGNHDFVLGRRDAYMFGPAIEFCGNLALSEGKALKRAFRNIPSDAALAFIDPTTRLLTVSAPDELPRTTAVATALDTLSGFAVVGLREDITNYVAAVGALLDIDERSIPVPTHLPKLMELAQRLREEADVEGLIAKDLELYDRFREAYERAGADLEGSAAQEQ